MENFLPLSHMIREVIGIGVDIINVQRFKHLVQKHGVHSSYVNRLALRILNHKHEYPKFQKLQSVVNQQHTSDNTNTVAVAVDKCAHVFAGSWAAKEALFKTLDVSQQKQFEFKNWYKTNDSNGKPSISWDVESGMNIEPKCNIFMLTISHDKDLLIATVLRQRFAEIKNQ